MNYNTKFYKEENFNYSLGEYLTHFKYGDNTKGFLYEDIKDSDTIYVFFIVNENSKSLGRVITGVYEYIKEKKGVDKNLYIKFNEF
jgi:hypothetical protein